MNPCDNTNAIKDFIFLHKLMSSTSNIYFSAFITVVTRTNTITKQPLDVLITFNGYDNYGNLTFLNSNIDPHLFPTVFDAKWQTFEHVNEEYLLIRGIHKQNLDIGKYEVKINPLSCI